MNNWKLAFPGQEKGKDVHSFHFIQHSIRSLNQGYQAGKKIKGIQTGKEKEKLLFIDDMIY